jgi:hypothetical protein
MYLYVIRLDDKVLDIKKFRDRNKGYVDGKPCSYVGTSVHDPDTRFEQHKSGYRSARFVRKFGLYLQRRHCQDLGNISREEAEELEKQKAHKLREKGWAVWQA